MSAAEFVAAYDTLACGYVVDQCALTDRADCEAQVAGYADVCAENCADFDDETAQLCLDEIEGLACDDDWPTVCDITEWCNDGIDGTGHAVCLG